MRSFCALFALLFVVAFSSSDKYNRQHRIVTLPNRLRCILVSDPDSDQEAATLRVAVGYFSDPDHLPGLAHFLEHMLFLGTTKYPDENSFSRFLSQHGGHRDASTSREDTSYHFELNKGHLSEALDRFSQFFYAPLFTESATDRELKAIENEHKMHCQNDIYRSSQFLAATSSANATALTKFGSGSYETLFEKPKASGIDTRQALLKFYSDYYSANLMCLSVVGSESLDVMQQYVEECFSTIPNTNRREPCFKGPAFDDSSLTKLFHSVPVKDNNTFRIAWEFPSTEYLYRTNPAQLLAHLLGHESKGSLSSILKARGLASYLIAGESFTATGFTLFTITIVLSPDGLKAIDDIIGIIFQYICLIQEASSDELTRLYIEKQQISDLNIRFKAKERPVSYSNVLARNLHKAQIEDVLSAHYPFRQFDESLIRRFASYLTPERARFDVESQTFSDICNLREKWYGTAYSVQSLPVSAQNKIKDDVLSSGLLHLPLPNPFIASDFALKSGIQESVAFNEAPVLLKDDDEIKLWFRNDRVFGTPTLNIMAMYSSWEAYFSPRAAILCQLFIRLLSECLTESAYNASIAGLTYKIDPKPEGFRLYIGGYNDKLHLLLAHIMEQMANPLFDQIQFELVRESLKRYLENLPLEQPYERSFYHQTMAVEVPYWPISMCLPEVENATLDDVLQFARRMLGRGKWHVLIHGNANEEEARSLSTKLTGLVPMQQSLVAQPDLRLAKLPLGIELMFAEAVKNPQESNSSALVYYQIGPDEVQTRARLRLIAHIANRPCFHHLRTVQQLGYIVDSGIQFQQGVLGFRVLVQSSQFSPLHLRARILSFMDDLREIIVSMGDDEFHKIRTAVIDSRTQKDKTLAEETTQIWWQISRHRYEFDARSKEATELGTITKCDLLSFYDMFLSQKGDKMRRFSSAVFGANQQLEIPADVHNIVNLEDFKRTLELYPAFES